MARTAPLLASLAAGAVALLSGASLAAASPGWTGPGPIFTPAGTYVRDTTVAFDGSGSPIVAWLRGDIFTGTAESSVRGVGSPAWGPIQSVPDGIDDWRQFSPQIVVDRAGDAVLAWTFGTMQGSRVLVSDRPAGGAWTAEKTLSSSVWAGPPGVAMDPDGKAIVVWPEDFAYSDPPKAAVVAAVRPLGSAWPQPSTLDGVTPASGHTASMDAADVALDPAGRAVAVWARTVDGATTLESSHRPAGGAWSAPQPVAMASGTVSGVKVRVDASGTATAAWIDGTSIMASRSPWGSDSWEAPTPLSGDVGGATGEFDLAVDPGGKAIVVWGAYDAISAAVHPVGGSWSARTTISASGASSPVVALDADGNAIAAWSRAAGIEAAVRPQGGDWSAPRTLSAAGHAAYRPSVAMSPTGDGIVAWADSDPLGDSTTAYAAWDATPPVLSGVQVPPTATAGRAVTVSMAAPADMWSAVPDVGWDFGDGTTAAGTSASHAWASPGVYTVTARARDALGNVATEPHQVTVAAPVVPVAPSGPPGTTGSVAGVVVVALPGASAGSAPRRPVAGTVRRRTAVRMRVVVPALTAGRRAVIGVRLNRAVRGALVRVQLRRGVRYRTIAQGRVSGRRIPVAISFAAPGRYLLRIQLREAGAKLAARAVPVVVRG